MKLAYSSNAYRRYSVQETIDRVASLGYDGIELMADVPHAWPRTTSNAEIDRIRRRLENRGLNISNVNAFMMNAVQDFWHPSTDGEGHSLVIVDEAAELAAWTERDGWKPSDLVLGSPGEEESFIGGRQLPSDANQDGLLDIGDVYRLLLFQYRGDALTPACEGTIVEGGNRVLLDGNADGLVDLADAVQLLAYLFQGGLPPSLGVVCIRIEGCPSACVR